MIDNQSESDVTPEVSDVTTSESDVTKATKTTRLNVADIEWLQEEAVDGESTAAVLSRLREELCNLRAFATEATEDMQCNLQQLTELQADLETLRTLRSGSSTAVTTTDQSSFSDFGSGAIKETMDVVKDVCDDETVCVKTAVHLVDTQAAMVSKQLDRDHSADQKQLDREDKQLDREDKEKDRQLKLELAEKKAQHERDMMLIKKGVVKDEDLEGVTFLGSMEKRKTAGERLADRKNRAYHAAAGEEDDFGDPEDGDAGEGDDDL